MKYLVIVHIVLNVNNFCIVSFNVIRPLRGISDKQGFTKFLTILRNCFVSVTVAVDKQYVKSSISISGFYDFLWFTVDFFILGPLKCLMTSWSIKSIHTTNSLFLWVPFLIQFFHVFVKHKCDLRLYVLFALVFLSSNFYLSINGDIVYSNFILCNHLQFYSPYYINTCNKLHDTCLLSKFFTLTI